MVQPNQNREKLSKNQSRKRPPAKTPEARENQMIALAVDLAEKQLSEGTASSQVISHFLKLASSKDRLEMELLATEVELKKAKTKAIQSSDRIEELYANAVAAMRSYTGNGGDDGCD